MKRFNQVFETLSWKPIRNCPGRYVLHGASNEASPASVLGEESRVREYHVATVRDTVLVTRLDCGGLISYRREDGSYLHTLNSPEGFERKLLQLGIELLDD